MNIFLTIFFFIFGTTLGSFYNVVGLRLPKGESFIARNDRSHCPNCNRQLIWYELIPVISYLLQAGKCRNCKSKVSVLYPFGELMTGLLFAFSFIQLGLEVELITAILFVSMLMIIVITDISYMMIPNKLLLFFLPFFVIMRIVVPLDPWWSPILGAIIGFGIVFIVIIVSRGGMGAGDMKLFFLLGIVLGIPKVLLTFLLACFIGAFVGIALIILKVVERRQPIPFGPYIVLAAIITYFFGDAILDWYFTLLSW